MIVKKVLIVFLAFALSLAVFAVSNQKLPSKIPSEVEAMASARLIEVKPNSILTATMNKPNGSEYRVGETIYFNVKNTKGGYLYILDVPQNGKITQLFPNYYQPKNFIMPGIHKIPSFSTYRFVVSGANSGIELVEFILSSKPLNFLQTAKTSKKVPFAAVGSVEKKEFVKFKLNLMKSFVVVPEKERWTSWTYFYLNAGKKTLLQVQSTPDGANLKVDGKFYGFTPQTVGVSAGYHNVLLSMKGYKDWRGTVFVGVGQTKSLNIMLVPSKQNLVGILKLNVSPLDATVYVDGKKVGNGNQELTVVAGYHNVVVEKNGYQSYYSDSIFVRPNLTTIVNINLKPLTANIYIHSQPYVRVYIDGTFAGGTGYDGLLYLTGVRVGYHRLKFEKEWYIVQTIDYKVFSGDNYLSTNLSEAGLLKANSNVYPLSLKVDGKYFGDIENSNTGIYVPIGSHSVEFSNPEYLSIKKVMNFEFQKTSYTSVYLKLKPLTLFVKAQPNPFSPNGDWYDDTTTFYITLSRSGNVKVEIFSGGQRIWYRNVSTSYGTTKITWDGNSISGQAMPNGVYKAKISVESYGQTMTKSLDVIINKSGYTYLKEIIIIGGLAILIGLIYLLSK